MDDHAHRTGMHPAVQAKWNQWAAKVARQEVDKAVEGLTDAIGYHIAQQSKARDAALAERDQRLDALERRLAALEGDEARVLNFSRVRGGKADAA